MATAGSWRRNFGEDDRQTADSATISFSRCAGKLQRMVYRDTEEFKNEIGTILDEINALDYSSPLAPEEVVSNVLRCCCHLVPLQSDQLVVKLCHLIHNLVNKQQLVLIHHCEIVLEYLHTALQQCPKSIYADIFHAMATVLFENAGRLSRFHDKLIGPRGLLHSVIDFEDPGVQRMIIHCLENICFRASGDEVYLTADHQILCFQTLLSVLQSPPAAIVMDEFTHSKMLIGTMKGLQNLLEANKSSSLTADLNSQLLAALQAYMFYGLPNAPSTVPKYLSSLPLDDHIIPGQPATPKPQPSAQQPASGSSGSKSASKRAKSRRNKAKKAAAETAVDEDGAGPDEFGSEFSRLAMKDDASNVFAALDNSDSDFSDVEQCLGTSEPRGRRCSSARIRLHALACFNAFVKVTERRTMFAFWPSFIPDSPEVGGATVNHTLLTVATKDSSSKVKVAALGVLSALLDGSKQFLMVAEDSDQYRVTPFTSLSVVVGRMVKELHRCLLLMLERDPSPFVVTQTLKCLATLISNVSYQRLRPSLLNAAVKQIRPYLSHRDPNIRVACLTCLGSVVSTSSPLLEVCHIIEPIRPSYRASDQSSGGFPAGSNLSASCGESGFVSMAAGADRLSPGPPTPIKPSSGSLTPGAEADSQAQPVTSWLVRLCVRCVAPQLAVDADGSRQSVSALSAQPLPVRLESLQVLALLSKNYFGIVRKSLPLMKELLQVCLMESDVAVQLHAAKLLDAIGSMLLQQQQQQQPQLAPDVGAEQNAATYVVQPIELWLAVLSGPLQNALQASNSVTVRSAVCDCLSDIGPLVFARLPVNIQKLCMTLLLGLSSDDDHHVRAAAVRALGCCIMYPCLREDVTFVADVSDELIKAATEPMLFVRWRVAWSLANLSDALVLNRNENNSEFMDGFASMVLSALFKTSIQLCSDNDKARYSAVRAVGNLLRYIPHQANATGRLKTEIEAGLNAIIKNITTGSVKVRWNACYAIANVFGNEVLHSQLEPRLSEIYAALAATLRNAKNFKVRISAVTAMATPRDRHLYGKSDTYLEIWRSFLDVLEGLDDVDADFVEYKYRDALVDQVCGTLIHTAGLLTVGDLDAVGPLVNEKRDVLSTHLKKHLELNANVAAEAALSHLRQLATLPDAASVAGDNVTIELLAVLLSSTGPAEAAGDNAGLTSGFRQIFD